MRTLISLCGLAALAATTTMAAEAPRQFDLACDGLRMVTGVREAQPFAVRYRVDLDRKAFCEGACEQQAFIALASADMLVLRQTGGANGDFIQVALARGAYTRTLIAPEGRHTWQGTCRVEAFSGFPSSRFAPAR
jgi:hypothetical protein